MRKMLKVFKILLITILFFILSYMKFYTTQVSFNYDPTIAIVKTSNIQILSNTYKITSDGIPYNWYDDYGFKILYADEMGHRWQTIHTFIIIAWWIMFFYLLTRVIRLAFKRFKNIKN